MCLFFMHFPLFSQIKLEGYWFESGKYNRVFEFTKDHMTISMNMSPEDVVQERTFRYTLQDSTMHFFQNDEIIEKGDVLQFSENQIVIYFQNRKKEIALIRPNASVTTEKVSDYFKNNEISKLNGKLVCFATANSLYSIQKLLVEEKCVGLCEMNIDELQIGIVVSLFANREERFIDKVLILDISEKALVGVNLIDNQEVIIEKVDLVFNKTMVKRSDIVGNYRVPYTLFIEDIDEEKADEYYYTYEYKDNGTFTFKDSKKKGVDYGKWDFINYQDVHVIKMELDTLGNSSTLYYYLADFSEERMSLFELNCNFIDVNEELTLLRDVGSKN